MTISYGINDFSELRSDLWSHELFVVIVIRVRYNTCICRIESITCIYLIKVDSYDIAWYLRFVPHVSCIRYCPRIIQRIGCAKRSFICAMIQVKIWNTHLISDPLCYIHEHRIITVMYSRVV